MDDEVHFSLEDLSEITGYHIDREINHGGYCTVFHGTDSKSGIEAAIKVESRKVEEDHKFWREAALIKRLKHPNLVRYLKHGSAKIGQGKIRFLAEEFLSRGNVLDSLDVITCFSVEACVRHMVSLCDFLGYLHSKGRMLLDLKPENLMFDADGTLKLVDIAAVQKTPYKVKGTVLGTPQYMSPDYAEKVMDHRSDIYSAGVIFYLMLTGRAPYDIDIPEKPVSEREWYGFFDKDRYPKMSICRPNIPPELSEIQGHMMAVYPLRRYQSMAAVLKDLKDFSQRHNLNISPHSAEL